MLLPNFKTARTQVDSKHTMWRRVIVEINHNRLCDVRQCSAVLVSLAFISESTRLTSRITGCIYQQRYFHICSAPVLLWQTVSDLLEVDKALICVINQQVSVTSFSWTLLRLCCHLSTTALVSSSGSRAISFSNRCFAEDRISPTETNVNGAILKDYACELTWRLGPIIGQNSQARRLIICTN